MELHAAAQHVAGLGEQLRLVLGRIQDVGRRHSGRLLRGAQHLDQRGAGGCVDRPSGARAGPRRERNRRQQLRIVFQPLRWKASAQAQSNTYSPYEWALTYSGMAAASVSPRYNAMNCGCQPDSTLALPDSCSACRKAYDRKGLLPSCAMASPSQAASPISDREEAI